VSLLSLITVIGVWWLARCWGTWAGLSAGLYLAASPYAVFYGRNIWQPNLLPFLSLLWVGAGWGAVTYRGRAQVFAIGLCCFMGLFVLQVHFAGLALVLGTAYLFIRLRWWRHWRPVAIGWGAAAACTLPYIYYLLTQAPQVITQFGQVGGSPAVIDLSAARNLLHLGIGYDWGYLALGDYDTFSRLPPTPLLAGLLLAFGIAALLRSLIVRRRSTPRHSSFLAPGTYFLPELTLLWLLISPLFFLRHTTPVLPHYQLVALPALALAVGAATILIAHPVWRIGITTVFTVLALIWTTQIAASLDRAAAERPPQSALSSILRESRAAAAGISADQPILFFTHGDDPAIHGEVAVMRVLLWPHPDARIIDGEMTLILPAEPATLMASLAPFQAWEELTASGLAGTVNEFPRRSPAPPFVSTAYDGARQLEGFIPITPSALEDGTVLDGWRVRRVGERLRVSTLWRVVNELPPVVLQQFHHLYPAQGESEQPQFVSDVSLSAQQLRVGDRLIVMADFVNVPPGDYALVVGHYVLPEVTRIPTQDGGEGSLRPGVFTWE
jgi:hypothetical protein